MGDHVYTTYTYCFDNKCSHIPLVRMPFIAWFGVWILSAYTDQMQYWTSFFYQFNVSEIDFAHATVVSSVRNNLKYLNLVEIE